ncbi:hypothetical protein A1OE_166 [Candidatus Endolissoclinum faulkneri L2]|uniref:Uncharacterized protein n=1 Tax=Candidatus Endolissoclinum faulkneri L2 TaxID=1193729 RepID=K7YP57_9PROT|nr:hypothetical protein A1OE_166 [Candidatus Endolissoclinum faulkneri L2]
MITGSIHLNKIARYYIYLVVGLFKIVFTILANKRFFR